jgi:acetolactate synthase-1/3 small subunit
MMGGPTHAPISQTPTPSPFRASEGEQTPIQSADKSEREAAARSFEHSAELYPGRQISGGVSASEALIAKNLHLSAIKTLADQFGGRVVDVAENSCIVELTAKSSRVDAFLSLMRPFGVLEAARSGEW